MALLNDLFGIQARGGCSCAGPYGHRLLGHRSRPLARVRGQITHGCEGIKPGWVRVNLNYFISDAVLDYLIEAVAIVAADGWRLLHDYRFDPVTGLWHHRNGPIEPPLRLRRRPLRRRGRCATRSTTTARREEALAGYLEAARELLRNVPQHLLEPVTALTAVRWLRAAAVVRAAAGLPRRRRDRRDTGERAPSLLLPCGPSDLDRQGRRSLLAGPLTPTPAHPQPPRAVSPIPEPRSSPMNRILHRHGPGIYRVTVLPHASGAPARRRRLLPRRRGAHPAPRRRGRRARRRARAGRHPPRRLRAGRPAPDGTRPRAVAPRTTRHRPAIGAGGTRSFRYHAHMSVSHPPTPSTSSSGTRCWPSRSCGFRSMFVTMGDAHSRGPLDRLGLKRRRPRARHRLRLRRDDPADRRAVRPGGRVLGTDLCEPFLEIARDDAAAAGVDNAEFAVVDAQIVPFKASSTSPSPASARCSSRTRRPACATSRPRSSPAAGC